MIGIGKWAYSIDTIYLKGDVVLDITQENGEYSFGIQIESDSDVPEFRFYDIVEEGNTLTGKGEVSLLPGKTLGVSLTFEGDEMTGFLKVPFIGKIKIKDGKRVV